MYKDLEAELMIAEENLESGNIDLQEFSRIENMIRSREAMIDTQMESEQYAERLAEARMEARFDVDYDDPYDDSPYW